MGEFLLDQSHLSKFLRSGSIAHFPIDQPGSGEEMRTSARKVEVDEEVDGKGHTIE